ncbi:hypothetical protein EYF80_008143 [Liparis tanakae]|uniref:Uncharacterized protein n=1 Tax=Liparis tanakae TaxID=230148 RepID=A0A4Z2IVC7_9TELE|nr:hypothetical protein EYF80_008143 [Liparis tanakae]
MLGAYRNPAAIQSLQFHSLGTPRDPGAQRERERERERELPWEAAPANNPCWTALIGGPRDTGESGERVTEA